MRWWSVLARAWPLRHGRSATYPRPPSLAARRHGYFQALPPREYVPVLWTEAELALLEGTELAGQVEADRQLMAADFEEHVLPLLGRYPGRLQHAASAFTREGFSVAASLVASRAFGIDDYHGG